MEETLKVKDAIDKEISRLISLAKEGKSDNELVYYSGMSVGELSRYRSDLIEGSFFFEEFELVIYKIINLFYYGIKVGRKELLNELGKLRFYPLYKDSYMKWRESYDENGEVIYETNKLDLYKITYDPISSILSISRDGNFNNNINIRVLSIYDITPIINNLIE